MTGQRGTVPIRQQAKTIVQALSDLFHSQDTGSRRGQFNSKRAAIQSLAYMDHVGQVRVRQCKVFPEEKSPLDKKTHGLILKRLLRQWDI
jgi:hypothetical protein